MLKQAEMCLEVLSTSSEVVANRVELRLNLLPVAGDVAEPLPDLVLGSVPSAAKLSRVSSCRDSRARG